MVMFTFLFSSGITLVGKFGLKIKNHRFKLRPGTQTNLKMQNSMLVFSFSVLDKKYTFAKFATRIKDITFDKVNETFQIFKPFPRH